MWVRKSEEEIRRIHKKSRYGNWLWKIFAAVIAIVAEAGATPSHVSYGCTGCGRSSEEACKDKAGNIRCLQCGGLSYPLIELEWVETQESRAC